MSGWLADVLVVTPVANRSKQSVRQFMQVAFPGDLEGRSACHHIEGLVRDEGSQLVRNPWMLQAPEETAVVSFVEQLRPARSLKHGGDKLRLALALHPCHITAEKRFRFRSAEAIEAVLAHSSQPGSGLSELRDNTFVVGVTRTEQTANLDERQTRKRLGRKTLGEGLGREAKTLGPARGEQSCADGFEQELLGDARVGVDADDIGCFTEMQIGGGVRIADRANVDCRLAQSNHSAASLPAAMFVS